MIDDAVWFEVLGRANIEAVLRLSAQGVAGPKHQGRKGNGISWNSGYRRSWRSSSWHRGKCI